MINGTTRLDMDFLQAKISGSYSTVLFDTDKDKEYFTIGDPVGRKPPGYWIETKFYVFIGDGDPYCYYEVAYDTWWLGKDDWKQHCLDIFREKKCIFVHAEKIEDSKIAFGVKHVERCLGIKGTTMEIEHGLNGWRHIHKYVSEPGIMTHHGHLYAIVDNHMVFQLSPHFQDIGLWYEHGKFHNHILIDNRRAWVKPSWLLVFSAKHFDELAFWANWRWIDYTKIRNYWNEETGTKNKPCKTILSNDALVNIPPYYGLRKSRKIDEWQLSCGKDICKCHTQPFQFFLDAHPEKITFINEEKGIFESLIQWLEKLLLKCLSWIMTTFFGPNWEIIALCSAVMYYFILKLTGNVVVACVVTFISFSAYVLDLN